MATKPKTPPKTEEPFIAEDLKDESTENPLDKIAAEIAKAKEEGAQRIRYSTEQKATILKWIEDYDSTHGRGGASQVVTKLGISPISISSWKNEGGEPKTRKPRTPKESTTTVKIDETTLLKVLVARGFKISRLRDELTGEIVREEFDPQIKNLELKYSPIPANAEDGVYVIQTSPQPQFAMNLDTLIRVAKMKV